MKLIVTIFERLVIDKLTNARIELCIADSRLRRLKIGIQYNLALVKILINLD